MEYETLQAEARRLAGEPGDIKRRAAVLFDLYQDSRGHHVFPMIALHGALWAYGFFETTGKLGRMIQYRYFYSPKERAFRMGLLNGFSLGFRTVNRSVFIDTYTNYHYTKAGGTGHMRPELLDALHRMHHANRNGRSMTDREKEELFLLSLRWEQEVTVGPAVKAEVEEFHCPVLTFLCLKPVVQFRYFPNWKYLFFKNFSNTDERIRNAHRSFEMARSKGWKKVEASMRAYRVLPDSFFRSPKEFVAAL